MLLAVVIYRCRKCFLTGTNLTIDLYQGNLIKNIFFTYASFSLDFLRKFGKQKVKVNNDKKM